MVTLYSNAPAIQDPIRISTLSQDCDLTVVSLSWSQEVPSVQKYTINYKNNVKWLWVSVEQSVGKPQHVPFIIFYSNLHIYADPLSCIKIGTNSDHDHLVALCADTYIISA